MCANIFQESQRNFTKKWPSYPELTLNYVIDYIITMLLCLQWPESFKAVPAGAVIIMPFCLGACLFSHFPRIRILKMCILIVQRVENGAVLRHFGEGQ